MHSGICGATLLSLIFFSTDVDAANAEPNRPENAEQRQPLLATQAQTTARTQTTAQTQTTARTQTTAQPLTPAQPSVRVRETRPVLPQTLPPSKPAPASHGDANATLANIPASKRLAISLGAGVLTLIAALWIGARRD